MENLDFVKIINIIKSIMVKILYSYICSFRLGFLEVDFRGE